MNRILAVFGTPRVLLPVIHPVSRDEALASVRLAHEAGVKGVFLIDQGMLEDEVLQLVLVLRQRFPHLWVGVNLRRRSPAQALCRALDGCEGRIDGIWSDNAGIDEDATSQPAAEELLQARRTRRWDGLYFGGVAFKYQRQVRDDGLGRAAARAERFTDVICTSGPGTGKEAQIAKVRAMRAALGPDGALALASGVNGENVAGYLPYVDAYLVGTGIEERFGVLDPVKLARLQDVIAASGPTAAWIPSLPLATEGLGPEARLRSGDWRQDAAYPEPVWARTAADLARRISIESSQGIYALHLIGHRGDEGGCRRLLELAGWSQRRRYRIGQVESARPIEHGFLRRLRLWPAEDAPEQPVDAGALVQAFIEAEGARLGDLEAWLRGRYGETPPADEIFDWIDYPMFDSGSMGVGFAVLVHGDELHVWSRCVHYHK